MRGGDRKKYLLLLSQIKLNYVIPNVAKRSEESEYFKISWFHRQISRFARNDTYLSMNSNNQTKQSY
jgi:hypothetical protein